MRVLFFRLLIVALITTVMSCCVIDVCSYTNSFNKKKALQKFSSTAIYFIFKTCLPDPASNEANYLMTGICYCLHNYLSAKKKSKNILRRPTSLPGYNSWFTLQLPNRIDFVVIFLAFHQWIVQIATDH